MVQMDCFNVGCLSKTNLILKSRTKSRLSLTHSLVFQAIWIVVLCAKLHMDWNTEKDVIGEWSREIWVSDMSFGRITYIDTPPCLFTYRCLNDQIYSNRAWSVGSLPNPVCWAKPLVIDCEGPF